MENNTRNNIYNKNNTIPPQMNLISNNINKNIYWNNINNHNVVANNNKNILKIK